MPRPHPPGRSQPSIYRLEEESRGQMTRPSRGGVLMRQILFGCFVLVLAIPVAAQKPIIFDVSNVVMGAQRIPTLWLFAEGQWSDAGDHIAPDSTQIFCYKSLAFCDVASA